MSNKLLNFELVNFPFLFFIHSYHKHLINHFSMESFISLYASPVHEPIIPTLEDIPYWMIDFFYIDFQYTHITLPSKHNGTKSFTTTTNESFFIPYEILCICNEFTVKERDRNIFPLYDIFFWVSIDILDKILPLIGKCARQMVAHNYEECDLLEMDISLQVITIDKEEEDDDKNQTNYSFVRKNGY